MPINSTQQASVVLNKAQFEAVKEAGELFGPLAPTITFEETNLENVLAVKTRRGLWLLAHDGTLTKLGAAAERVATKHASTGKAKPTTAAARARARKQARKS